jgi:hypothetical protein
VAKKKETAPEVPVQEQSVSKEMKAVINTINCINYNGISIQNSVEESIAKNIINEFKGNSITIHRATAILKFCIEILRLTKVN